MTDLKDTTQQYWDDAYDNSKSIGGSESLLHNWTEAAAAFRHRTKTEERLLPGIAYGDGERNCFDLFLPDNESDSLGLVVFVHGGYWHRLGRENFSHLANGPTARGWTVAIPSYDLCPQVGIADIAKQMAAALEAAIEQSGSEDKPVRLIGHSAGGHLVTRLVSKQFVNSHAITTDTTTIAENNTTDSSLLAKSIIQNIERVVSVSGLHDLRPLLNTSMNEALRLNPETASVESPALMSPVTNLPVTCWVGADELPELKRQTSLLANIWRGFGLSIEAIAEPNKNHFDVIEGLANPSSPLVEKLLS